MKRTTFLLALIYLGIGCTPDPQEAVHQVIRQKIQRASTDPGSYESISFSGFDTIQTAPFYKYKVEHVWREKNRSGVLENRKAVFTLGTVDGEQFDVMAVDKDSLR